MLLTLTASAVRLVMCVGNSIASYAACLLVYLSMLVVLYTPCANLLAPILSLGESGPDPCQQMKLVHVIAVFHQQKSPRESYVASSIEDKGSLSRSANTALSMRRLHTIIMISLQTNFILNFQADKISQCRAPSLRSTPKSVDSCSVGAGGQCFRHLASQRFE